MRLQRNHLLQCRTLVFLSFNIGVPLLRGRTSIEKGENMKTVLGIDNGLKGALAFYNGEELIVHDMPVFEMERKQIDLIKLREIILSDKPDHVFIEKLTPIYGGGKMSTFVFFGMGHSEGIFLATLSFLEIPFTFVTPQSWKKEMQCPANKDASRMRASQLLPQFAHNWDLKKHDGRAEASLIALYGFRKLGFAHEK